jgi:hypothetical protein
MTDVTDIATVTTTIEGRTITDGAIATTITTGIATTIAVMTITATAAVTITTGAIPAIGRLIAGTITTIAAITGIITITIPATVTTGIDLKIAQDLAGGVVTGPSRHAAARMRR